MKISELKTLDQFFDEQMNDPEFAKEYEAIQPEIQIMKAMIKGRAALNMTQKELAERTGIDQADISKLENGTRNPSISLLKRVADGLGMNLKIDFVQKNTY